MTLFDHEVNSHVGHYFTVKTDVGSVLMVCTRCEADHRVLKSCNSHAPGTVEICHLDWHDAVSCGIIERTNYKSLEEIEL